MVFMRPPNQPRAWEKRHSATLRDAFPMHLLIAKLFLLDFFTPTIDKEPKKQP